MKKLILHCSDSANPLHGVDEIRRWHVEERGWSDIGYHWVIERDGSLKAGRPENIQGAHTLGHNKDIGLCMCGKSGSFTTEQRKTLEKFVVDNYDKINGVFQHSDFEKKKPFCAGFTESQMNYLKSLV